MSSIYTPLSLGLCLWQQSSSSHRMSHCGHVALARGHPLCPSSSISRSNVPPLLILGGFSVPWVLGVKDKHPMEIIKKDLKRISSGDRSWWWCFEMVVTLHHMNHVCCLNISLCTLEVHILALGKQFGSGQGCLQRTETQLNKLKLKRLTFQKAEASPLPPLSPEELLCWATKQLSQLPWTFILHTQMAGSVWWHILDTQ